MQDAYKIYYQTKELAIALEKQNNNKIIVFPSVKTKGQKDEWYKIGGNSALFYKYFIAPRLNKKSPTIQIDRDSRIRFKDGIISVHWKSNLIENMKNLNYLPKEQDGLLIFNLKRTFTDQEIQNLRTREKEDRVKANQLIIPKIVHPELYFTILKLARLIPTKAALLHKSARTDFGTGLNRTLTEFLITYLNLADGQIDIKTAKISFQKTATKLSALLIILNETKFLSVNTENQLGQLLNELKLKIGELKNV